ncbi:MAG: hypothetical protein ACLUD0_02375 [Eubacterium ramulus]
MKTKTHPKLTDKKWMPTLVWILCIVAIWEIMACVVATTKRTPENILPHIYQILYSLISTKKVTGTQTALQVVALASVQTLLRAAVGFLIGMVAGFGLALLMKLSGIVEKLAFPYLMLIQLIPILGMAPIILSLTGSIGVSRIVIARDPYFLSGGGQYTGWFEIGTAGKIRIDVFLRGEPQNNL